MDCVHVYFFNLLEYPLFFFSNIILFVKEVISNDGVLTLNSIFNINNRLLVRNCSWVQHFFNHQIYKIKFAMFIKNFFQISFDLNSNLFEKIQLICTVKGSYLQQTSHKGLRFPLFIELDFMIICHRGLEFQWKVFSILRLFNQFLSRW